MTTPDEAQTLLPVTPELLPCGNCGAPARWIKNAWRIKCTRPSCGVEGGKFEQKHVAITAWNTRSQSHSLPGDVGRLVAAAKIGLLSVESDIESRTQDLEDRNDDIDADETLQHYREQADEIRAALTPSPCPGDVGTALQKAQWLNLMPREIVARAALNEGCRDKTANDIRSGLHGDVKIRAEVAVKLVGLIQEECFAAALTPSAQMESVMRAAAISSSEHRYDISALSGDAGEGE